MDQDIIPGPEILVKAPANIKPETNVGNCVTHTVTHTVTNSATNSATRVFIAVVLLVAGSGMALGQTGSYPNKPIKLVVGFPPGTPPEVIGRLMVDRMSASLGQPIVVENRPGAAGTLAANAVMQAPADGYTLMIGVAGALASAAHLLPSARFDPGWREDGARDDGRTHADVRGKRLCGCDGACKVG